MEKILKIDENNRFKLRLTNNGTVIIITEGHWGNTWQGLNSMIFSKGELDKIIVSLKNMERELSLNAPKGI